MSLLCYILIVHRMRVLFFFFSATATTEIYTLSLHDALPILLIYVVSGFSGSADISNNQIYNVTSNAWITGTDRKSTRLNSSHITISYAVFCLKKKNHKSPQITYLRSQHHIPTICDLHAILLG